MIVSGWCVRVWDAVCKCMICGERTKSSTDPPAKNSMIIHSLVPFKYDPKYLVTYGLSHWDKTDISV